MLFCYPVDEPNDDLYQNTGMNQEFVAMLDFRANVNA